jgi:hypothetical protein
MSNSTMGQVSMKSRVRTRTHGSVRGRGAGPSYSANKIAVLSEPRSGELKTFVYLVLTYTDRFYYRPIRIKIPDRRAIIPINIAGRTNAGISRANPVRIKKTAKSKKPMLRVKTIIYPYS